MIQRGLLSIILCVRMTAVDKQDKINNENSTTVLCYWIYFFFLSTCDGKYVAAQLENVKLSFNVSISWDHVLCYMFTDELFAVDSVALLPDCQAIGRYGLLQTAVLLKSMNSLTDVLGSCL